MMSFFTRTSLALEFVRSKKYTLVGAAIIILLSFAYSPQLTIMLLSLGPIYLVIDRTVSVKIFPSRILLGVVTFITYVAILQMSFFIGWLVYKEINLIESSGIAFVIGIAMLNLVWNKKPGSRRLFATRFDLIAIAATLIFCIPFFGVPLYKEAKVQSNAPALTLIDVAVDDTSHLGMLNDRIQFDRGVLAGTKEAKNSRFDGVIYPAGWPSANAVIAKALFPKIEPGIQSALYYAVNKSAWFIILSYIFVRTTGTILEIQKRKTSLFALLALTFSCIAALTIFFADIYITGFYSFLPVVITSCLLIPCMFEIFGAKEPKEVVSALILPSLLISLSTLSWLLVLPMYGIAIVLIGLERSRYILRRKGWSRRLALTSAFIMIIVGLSTIAQLKVSSSAQGAVSFVEGILIPGGTITYPPVFYIFCVALLVLFVIFSKRKYVTPALLYLSGIIIFISIIYAIQQYKNQFNTYYFYKSLAVFTSAALVLGIGGLAMALSKIYLRSRVTSLALGFALPALLVMVLFPNPTTFTFVSGKRPTSTGISHQLYDELSKNYTVNNYYKKDITIFYPSDNPALNEVGSTILKVNRVNNLCYPILKSDSFITKSDKFDTKIIEKSECKDYKIKYYVDKQDARGFKEKIKAADLSNKVTIEILDTKDALVNSSH